MIVSKPGKKQLLKMKRRASEGLGFACECSEISAHGVVDPFDEGGLDFAREAVKAKAHLDVRQKADHGDGLDAEKGPQVSGDEIGLQGRQLGIALSSHWCGIG